MGSLMKNNGRRRPAVGPPSRGNHAFSERISSPHLLGRDKAVQRGQRETPHCLIQGQEYSSASESTIYRLWIRWAVFTD